LSKILVYWIGDSSRQRTDCDHIIVIARPHDVVGHLIGSVILRRAKAAGRLLWRMPAVMEGCTMFKELFRPSPKIAPAARPLTGTVIGPKAKFEGTLTSEGDLRLDGLFTGSVSARGQVTIGESGSLKGGLIGGVVRVAGMVRGNITAHKVAILKTGRVYGDLLVEALITEEGGFIQGQIRMEESVDLSEHFPEPSGEADISSPPDEPTLNPQKSMTPRAVKVSTTTGKTASS
jgi:cytoskeletal protein CcmA (bactofilin family)